MSCECRVTQARYPSLTRQSCLCREGVRRVRMHIPFPHGPQQSVYLIPAIQERICYKNRPSNSSQKAQNAFSHNLISFNFFWGTCSRTPSPQILHLWRPSILKRATLALKLVYGPAKIFGSNKPICLKVEDSKLLANGRSRVGTSPLFNIFFLAIRFY